MLWHKAWLETRWRFISALVILTVLAGGNVFDYLATRRLLPQLNATTDSAGCRSHRTGRRDSRSDRDAEGLPRLHLVSGVPPEPDADGRVLRGAARMRRAAARSVQEGLGALHAVVAGDAQTAARRAHRNGTRATASRSRWCRRCVIPILAPSIGQHFSVVDALAHGVCIFFVGAVFFSLASFLSTLFGDIWRPLLIAIGIACAVAIVSVFVPQLGIFSVMNGESYFRNGIAAVGRIPDERGVSDGVAIQRSGNPRTP